MKAFTVAVVSCVHMLESCTYLCMILFCVFLCLPSSSSLPSSSPPIPPPCQACPRCSHTQDPSARCKEPSSPRSAPHPYPQPTLYKQAENLIKIAPANTIEKLPRRAHKANKMFEMQVDFFALHEVTCTGKCKKSHMCNTLYPAPKVIIICCLSLFFLFFFEKIQIDLNKVKQFIIHNINDK